MTLGDDARYDTTALVVTRQRSTTLDNAMTIDKAMPSRSEPVHGLSRTGKGCASVLSTYSSRGSTESGQNKRYLRGETTRRNKTAVSRRDAIAEMKEEGSEKKGCPQSNQRCAAPDSGVAEGRRGGCGVGYGRELEENAREGGRERERAGRERERAGRERGQSARGG
eukprot:1827384-Rhodomonas_salina.3